MTRPESGHIASTPVTPVAAREDVEYAMDAFRARDRAMTDVLAANRRVTTLMGGPLRQVVHRAIDGTVSLAGVSEDVCASSDEVLAAMWGETVPPRMVRYARPFQVLDANTLPADMPTIDVRLAPVIHGYPGIPRGGYLWPDNDGRHLQPHVMTGSSCAGALQLRVPVLVDPAPYTPDAFAGLPDEQQGGYAGQMRADLRKILQSGGIETATPEPRIIRALGLVPLGRPSRGVQDLGFTFDVAPRVHFAPQDGDWRIYGTQLWTAEEGLIGGSYSGPDIYPDNTLLLRGDGRTAPLHTYYGPTGQPGVVTPESAAALAIGFTPYRQESAETPLTSDAGVKPTVFSLRLLGVVCE